ncbi:MAG: DUF2292 domain-containing protein [Bacillota bacterium]
MSLVQQIIAEVQAAAERIAKVRYGEIVVVVQDGCVVRVKVTESWQPGDRAPPEKSSNGK